MIDEIKHGLSLIADSDKAKELQRFFKTKKGEYAEGDVFIGVKVPFLREISEKYYKKLSLSDCESLLQEKIHEYRMLSLFMLCLKYSKSSGSFEREEVVDVYLRNTAFVNNWDLVDCSAYKIIGPFANETSDDVIVRLAESFDLWENRIAMIACYHYIKLHEFSLAFSVAEMLLTHPHDLIHKAVGWMLREIGKRNREEEEKFLKLHYDNIPRTALRYAIEKFPPELRKQYLLKDF